MGIRQYKEMLMMLIGIQLYYKTVKGHEIKGFHKLSETFYP